MGRGRGVSYGGGQSSLSYLFGGGGDEPVAAPAKPTPAAVEQRAQQPAAAAAAPTPAATVDGEKQKGIPAGVRGSQTNNYFRAQGQNCGNFLTVSQPAAGDLVFLLFPLASPVLTSLSASATA